jgi:hypothetical protein
MLRIWVFAVGLLLFSLQVSAQDYHAYHAWIREIEHDLLDCKWDSALSKYLKLEQRYDFLFIKDLKIALQLAYRRGESSSLQRFSEAAFVQGWDWKKVRRDLKENPDFRTGLQLRLKAISKQTERSKFPNPEIRQQVKKLFIQDQWQALGALFVFPSERRERYIERKIAVKARLRAEEIWKIIDTIGYPGERMIANAVWASTILSHYNSLSEGFVKADTLYLTRRSILQREIEQGRISPFEFALIDNWYQSVSSHRAIESYGILEGEVTSHALNSVNANRLAVGLQTIEDHNRLLQLQKDTGIMLYFGQVWGNSSVIRVRK